MLFYCPQNNVLSINIPCLSCGCSHPRQFFNSNTRGDEIALHKALHFHTSFYCVCKPSSCLSVVHTPLILYFRKSDCKEEQQGIKLAK